VTEDQISHWIENEYMGLSRDFNAESLYNPLLDVIRQETFDGDQLFEFLDIMSNPDYFSFTCKWLLNVNLAPFQCFILKEFWTRKFPMLIGTRGCGKSFLLSLYAILRAILNQGTKIIIVGAAFRQSKLLFEYMENIWANAPMFRALTGTGRKQGPTRDIDRCSFYIGNSVIHAIPLGNGEKIRGLRANYVICDEFAYIQPEIYEVVIKGFSSVSANPVERSISMTRIEVLKSLGMYMEAENEKEDLGFGNQTILSGTATYSFNHFYTYWKRYKAIIESGGNERILEKILSGEIPRGFNWKDFSVLRVPYHKMPYGYMDETQIAQAQATVNSYLYNMEYGAIFLADSDGFFKRSLLESCVTKYPILLPSGPVQFHALLSGDKKGTYVYGVDPASERDNFAIVVLEVHPDHRRIVYGWTITREDMHKRMKDAPSRQSFYKYCANKIRSLMQVFPTQHIVMDSEGGGISIIEALRDTENLPEGTLPILPYVKQGKDDVFWWEEEEKPTDAEPGLHILHMVDFADAVFCAQANNGTRFDFESKTLLFPYFDSVTLEESIALDKLNNNIYDTFEDAVMEIESLKDELVLIQQTQTPNGRDRWDTPPLKLPGGKKGKYRKDRYSALIMANQVARLLQIKSFTVEPTYIGGYAGQAMKAKGGQLFTGPAHIIKQMGQFVGKGFSVRI